MGMNMVYRGPADCPDVLPVFPLPGALLLPRGQMPLNIFEPRYLAMVDDALKGHRMIGMVQPNADEDGPASAPRLYPVGEDEVDRAGVLRALRNFVEAADVKVDWKGIDEAPNEALVNALCMMSPFGPREKQALLEAPDLKTRAEVLIAITAIELARGEDSE